MTDFGIAFAMIFGGTMARASPCCDQGRGHLPKAHMGGFSTWLLSVVAPGEGVGPAPKAEEKQ